MKPFEDLSTWLSHLETLHPKTIDLGLTRITSVADRLGVRQDKPMTITVAGTNGKGTTVATLQHLLKQQGVSVGTYTSPHLIAFNERIAIGGVPASDARILAAFAEIEAARGDITLSYFEFATLAALLIFKQEAVDWQILEVGLGGRLDAVNCVDTDLAIVTSIGLDHTEWLGDTREEIAPEKAGIARRDKPAIVAELQPPPTLQPALDAIGAESYTLGRDWQLAGWRLTLPGGRVIDLPPSHSLQGSNMAAAVVALDLLGLGSSQEEIYLALREFSVAGRQFRSSHKDREWWLDVSHNRESVSALIEALAVNPCSGATHLLFGAMADKPLRDMIASASTVGSVWHLPDNKAGERPASPASLAELINVVDPLATTRIYESPEGAYEGVLGLTEQGDRIVVFGSFVTIGEQMKLMQKHGSSGV